MHPTNEPPPELAKSWVPPFGLWEDEIQTVDVRKNEKTGELIVYLIWKHGEMTKHSTSVVYQKCPQKVWSCCILTMARDPADQDTTADAQILRAACSVCP